MASTETESIIDPASHTEWVRAFTQKFLKQHSLPDAEFEELVGIAYLGLVEAAEKFDSSTGVPFRAYARIRVRGALLDGLVSIGGLSRAGHKKARALKALTEYREQDEIKRRSQGDAEEKLAQVFEQAAQAALVHRMSYVADDGEEIFEGESETPEESVAKAQVNTLLREAVDKLPQNQQLVVREYYFKQRTFEEIGEEHGMSKGWISKVHRKAMESLHRTIADLE